ncbi:MAG TPA: hypothetical protein PKV84_05955 [Candidatus Omnitrophota bacterium]|nr:hypothetical protein [Candidatus Omnitrophota bacterium]
MREEKNDSGEKQHFYMLEARHAELVELGKISLEDLGALSLMGCNINPHNGYMITGHSDYAGRANIKPSQARYLFEKLESAGLIRFLLLQRGRYSKGLLFVMGRKLAGGMTVNDEFVSKTAKKRGVFSELESDFPNKKITEIPSTDTLEVNDGFRIDREGEGKETETERERDNEPILIKAPRLTMEIAKHPLFKRITEANWDLIYKKYEYAWLDNKLQDLAGRLNKGPISFDRLNGMLQDDWTQRRPAKDYRREDEKQKADMRQWAADQKADEGKPDPECLIEWRKKRDRMKGSGTTEAMTEAGAGEST